MPEREARGAERVRGRAGEPGQLLVAEPGALGRGQELGGLGVGRRRPAACPIVATSRFERDVAAHLGEEPGRDPGRLADDRLRHAAPQQAEEPPQPRVGRLEEPAQHDRRGGPLGVAGRLAGLAALVDPVDRLVGLGVAGVDAGEVVERRGPASGPRPAARRRPARGRGAPCSAPSRTSGRWPSPRRSPSSGCRASGRRVGNLSNGKRGSLTTT